MNRRSKYERQTYETSKWEHEKVYVILGFVMIYNTKRGNISNQKVDELDFIDIKNISVRDIAERMKRPNVKTHRVYANVRKFTSGDPRMQCTLW